MEQRADGRYGPWTLVETSCSKIVDSGDPTLNTFVLHSHPRSETTVGNSYQLSYARFSNRSGGAADFGIGVRLARGAWKAGQWVHGTTTFTDDTTDFQNTTVDDAPIETTTNNDGMVVLAVCPFNVIAFAGGVAQAGSPTRTLEYSLAGGTWTSLSGAWLFSTNFTGTGTEMVAWFNAPSNWGLTEAGHGTGVPVGYYGLRMRATTAPSTAAVVKSISVHRIYGSVKALANNTTAEVRFDGIYAPLEANGDALTLVQSSPNAASSTMALFRCRG